jgi:ATP-dependent DNA helicase RecG
MDAAALLDTLSALLRLPREQGTVEFKSNLVDPEDIGQYLSALANTAALHGHHRAWLVWGVADDDHRVTGTRFDPFNRKAAGNQALVMWLQTMTQPRADFQFHELQHPQGRVVMLEIHPARSAPIAFQHRRYIRIDSHKVSLSEHPDKEARLWTALGVKEDWSGAVVPGASLDDLDPAALAAARERFADYMVRCEPDARRHEASAPRWRPCPPRRCSTRRTSPSRAASRVRRCCCWARTRPRTSWRRPTPRSAGSCVTPTTARSPRRPSACRSCWAPSGPSRASAT